MDDDTHLAVVMIAPDQLVRILNWRHDPAGSYIMVGGPSIPEDATVSHCFYDYSSRSLSVVLEHPSFDKVQPGAKMPYLDGGEVRFMEKEAGERPRERREWGNEIFDVQPGATAESEAVFDEVVQEVCAEKPDESSGDYFRRVMGTG